MKCAVGGECKGALQAHHDDYRKPLDIRWLCRRHHSIWHSQHGHAPGWPPNDKIQVATWLPPNEAKALRELARQERRSVSQTIRFIILDALATKTSGPATSTPAKAKA